MCDKDHHAQEQKYLGLAETAERLCMNPAEIYREVQAGRLSASMEEGNTRFSECDIKAFIESRDKGRMELLEEVDKWNNILASVNTDANESMPKEAPDSHSDPSETMHGNHDVDQYPAQERDPDAEATALAERILHHAYVCGVLNVYLDPVENGFRLLYRTHKGLAETGRFSQHLGDIVTRAMKAKLGSQDAVTEPVESLTNIKYGERNIQILGSVAPTLLGEHVHLRFRDSHSPVDLTELGYNSLQAEVVQNLLAGRAGVLLVTGAADTCSDQHRLGLAQMLASGNRLVVSLEHRVHFKSEILVQLEMANTEGADFTERISAALTMSPDVLFIDDIRTQEEARSLFDAVAAGITVVAQIRSPGNFPTLKRMMDFGVSAQVLARDLLGLIARRSFRRVCPHCSEQRPLQHEEAEYLGAPHEACAAEIKGCHLCRKGFRGRRDIQDIWINTPELAELIAAPEIQDSALQNLAKTSEYGIAAAARDAVMQGEIIIDDVQHIFAPSP